MTNKCDLEEVKHIAQQKFIELVDSGVGWEVGRAVNMFCSDRVHELHGYRVIGHWVSLKGEQIWGGCHPREREAKKNKDGSYNKLDVALAKKEHAEALEDYESMPMVVAVRTLESRAIKAEEEARCLRMQADIESSCKALQAALGNTGTTPATTSYDGHTEPYSGSQGYSKGTSWWGRFWRGL